MLLGRHRASLWSSATHRGLSFRICPRGCPCNGCADASLSLLIHSHPCLCQGNGSPLSVLLYVKPHLPSVLSEIQHATQLICSEEQLIFFFIFHYLHQFCRAQRNKSDSSLHWWSQQPRGGFAWGAVLPSKVTLSNTADWSQRRHKYVLTLCKSLDSSQGSGWSQKEPMADLGVGAKHDPMIVDDPLCCPYILGKKHC